MRLLVTTGTVKQLFPTLIHINVHFWRLKKYSNVIFTFKKEKQRNLNRLINDGLNIDLLASVGVSIYATQKLPKFDLIKKCSLCNINLIGFVSKGPCSLLSSLLSRQSDLITRHGWRDDSCITIPVLITTCVNKPGCVNLNHVWVLQTITKEEQQEEE